MMLVGLLSPLSMMSPFRSLVLASSLAIVLSLVDTSAHRGALLGGVRFDKVPSILFLAGFELPSGLG